MPVRDRVPVGDVRRLRRAGDGIRVREVDLERHADEAVGQREEDVGGGGGGVAPEDGLVELEGRVAARVEVLQVDGEVEGEAEEGDYYEVYCASVLLNSVGV